MVVVGIGVADAVAVGIGVVVAVVVVVGVGVVVISIIEDMIRKYKMGEIYHFGRLVKSFNGDKNMTMMDEIFVRDLKIEKLEEEIKLLMLERDSILENAEKWKKYYFDLRIEKENESKK